MDETELKRAPNFTPEDKNILLGLIDKHRVVINNTENTKEVSKEKSEIWELIAVDYNTAASTNRTTSQLKIAYKYYKKKLRSLQKRKQLFIKPDVALSRTGNVAAPRLENELIASFTNNDCVNPESVFDEPTPLSSLARLQPNNQEKPLNDRSQRGVNFLDEERKLLLYLIAERDQIINCKTINKKTTSAKLAAWREIVVLYNAVITKLGGITRTRDQLKIAYKTYKRRAKILPIEDNLEFYAGTIAAIKSESVKINQQINEFKMEDEEKDKRKKKRRLKKNRSRNFTNAEKKVLLKLVKRYDGIIMEKRNFSEIIKAKVAAWEKIAHLFNQAGFKLRRTVKQLREGYKGLKRRGINPGCEDTLGSSEEEEGEVDEVQSVNTRRQLRNKKKSLKRKKEESKTIEEESRVESEISGDERESVEKNSGKLKDKPRGRVNGARKQVYKRFLDDDSPMSNGTTGDTSSDVPEQPTTSPLSSHLEQEVDVTVRFRKGLIDEMADLKMASGCDDDSTFLEHLLRLTTALHNSNISPVKCASRLGKRKSSRRFTIVFTRPEDARYFGVYAIKKMMPAKSTTVQKRVKARKVHFIKDPPYPGCTVVSDGGSEENECPGLVENEPAMAVPPTNAIQNHGNTDDLLDHLNESLKTGQYQRLPRPKENHQTQTKDKCTVSAVPKLKQKHNRNPNPAEKTPCVCEICGCHLNSIANLRNHMALHGMSRRQFRCEFCNKTLASRSALADHRRVHTKEKPFVCQYCSKRYSMKTALNAHVKQAHTHENLLYCSYCSRGFALTTDLKMHEKRHRDEDLYECRFCLKKFVQECAYLRHMHRKHGVGQMFKCHCGSTFVYKHGYNRHMVTHHGTTEAPVVEASLQVIAENCAGEDNGLGLLDSYEVQEFVQMKGDL